MDDEQNKCTEHPDKEGAYHCSKYNRYMCAECIKCQDPTLFCKFRTSCLIWEISRYPEEYFDQASEPGS